MLARLWWCTLMHLWFGAGERLQDSWAEARGMPAAQVVTYKGRAAVPLAPLLGSFQKSFFLQPRTLDPFGRVQVR